LVNNTIKHGKARFITINLNYNNDLIDILFDDDGRGCNIEEIIAGNTKGTGLQNVLSRISSINGYVEMNSEAGKGFHAYINIKTNNTDEKA
jgi:signal transduction histidine kinase